MNMTLFNYAGDVRKLNKYLNTIATVNIITITDETNILAPTVIIGRRAFNFNYAYIPAFNRYYFVENVDIMRGERIAVHLRVDVLMSHKTAILQSNVIADRSASNSDPYIVDNKVGSRDKANTYVRNVAHSPFNTKTFVLSTGGK